MINKDFRTYEYFLYTDKDAYAQPVLSKEPQGTVKMAIYLTSQSVVDNINYKNASYVGLTYTQVDDTYAIDYNGTKLKVLYVNPQGRLNQVFMAEI